MHIMYVGEQVMSVLEYMVIYVTCVNMCWKVRIVSVCMCACAHTEAVSSYDSNLSPQSVGRWEVSQQLRAARALG